MGFLMILGMLFFYYKKKIDKVLILIIAATIYLILFQTLYFGGGKLFTTVTLTGLLILLPYFAIKLIGPQFLKYYRDVMVVIALISLGFWIVVNISPGLHSASLGWAQKIGGMFGLKYNDNFIVYTYENMKVYGLYRNPGPFHEPGAFSVFLMLAIISEIFVSGKLFTKNNLFFFANLATTFSTAGYLGIFIIFGFYIYISNRMTLLTKVFVSASMVAVMVYLFLTLDFLSDKISSQVNEQTKESLNTPTSGRFLGARKAIIVIYRYPLFGRGLLTASQAEANSDEAAGYGWINWISRIGIIFGLIYMFMLYKALRNYSIINLHNRFFALFALMAVLTVLAGQMHTSSLVYFSLFLMPIVFHFRENWQDYLLSDQKPEANDKSKMRKEPSFEDYAKLVKEAKREGLVD